MKQVHYEKPNSSFLSLEKDTKRIVQKMLDNDNLKKLLYRTEKTCLSPSCPVLTKAEEQELIEKEYIRIVPKIEIDENIFSYVIISYDNFAPNDTNPEFRDNILSFDIVCHFDYWKLTDFQLRPYKIAGEIDSMINNKKLTGIGEVYFMGANQIVLNEELAGLSLTYAVIHGSDDRVNE